MPLDAELDPHFEEAARLNNLDPMLLRALVMGESSGRTLDKSGGTLTSEKGAQGIAQFIPETAAKYGVDVKDPVSGIYGAARLLNDNLTVAEQKRAAGRDDIVPVDYALKMYFAGDEGPQWGEKTTAYPGYIASNYQKLVNQRQSAPSGVDKLASLTAQPREPEQTPDGVAALASVRAHGPAALPFGTNPGVKVQVGLGDDAPVVQPPVAANPQMAQAAPGGGPSDDEILKMLRQVYPTSKATPDVLDPGQAVKGLSPRGTPIVDTGDGAVIPLGGPTAAPGASAITPAGKQADPAFSVQGLLDTYNKFGDFPGGAQRANAAIQLLMKMTPEKFELMQDGTLRLREGAAGGEHALAAATSAGKNLETFDAQGNVIPMGGAAQSAQTLARAKAEGEEGPKRVTAAVAPQHVAPGVNVLYPPGSPNAGIAAASGLPEGPLGAQPAPGGGTAITGAPANESTKLYHESLSKLGDTANEARNGMYQANLLKDQLHAIGTSGPATAFLGSLSSLAAQVGVPKETIEKFALPEGATVTVAEKLAQDLLGEVLKTTFPSRITNADITGWKNTVPRANSRIEANDFLIDRVLNPKFQRDIDRYGAAVDTDLPAQTPKHLLQFLNKWDNEHPYESFVAPSAGAEPAAPPKASLRYDPKTNKLIPVQ